MSDEDFEPTGSGDTDTSVSEVELGPESPLRDILFDADSVESLDHSQRAGRARSSLNSGIYDEQQEYNEENDTEDSGGSVLDVGTAWQGRRARTETVIKTVIIDGIEVEEEKEARCGRAEPYCFTVDELVDQYYVARTLCEMKTAKTLPEIPLVALDTNWDRVLDEMVQLSEYFNSLRRWKLAQAKKLAIRASKGKLDLATRGEKEAKALEISREPHRPITHWDHVLEEMLWLSSGFQSQRKWKLAQARKLAVSASKGMLEKDTRGEKGVKDVKPSDGNVAEQKLLPFGVSQADSSSAQDVKPSDGNVSKQKLLPFGVSQADSSSAQNVKPSDVNVAEDELPFGVSPSSSQADN